MRWGVVGLILFAWGLRLWNLDILPPGLNYDEAFDGFSAHRIASGGYFPIYLSGNTGREPLFMYVQALFVKILGPSAYALRVASALTGVLSISIIYFTAQSLLKRLSQELGRASNSLFLATLPALVAAAGIAVSFWHLSLSRSALRVILFPAMGSLAVAFFWRAWDRHRLRDYAFSAVFLALSLYTYTAARLLPAVIALFAFVELGGDILRSRRFGRAVWAPWRVRVIGLTLMLGISALLLAPMVRVYQSTPELLSARISDVSVFGIAQSEGVETPVQKIAHNLVAVARSFYTAGDRSPRLNLPNRPVNDPVLAVLFTLGWITCLVRFRQSWSRLLLIWLVGMLLPTVLSADAPHSLRAAGALPPLALLYGVGAAAIVRATLWLRQREWPRTDSVTPTASESPTNRRWHLPIGAGGTVLVAVVVLSGASTSVDYFVHWSQLRGLGAEFATDRQLAAQAVAELLRRPDGGPVLVSSQLLEQPQMAYALGKVKPQVTLPQPVLAERAGTGAVPFFEALGSDSRQSNYLLWRSDGQIQMARLGPLASSVVSAPVSIETEPLARLRSRIHQPGWPEVAVSSLPATMIPRPEQIRYPVDVAFANGMQLVGYDIEPETTQPGDAQTPFRLTLYWRAAGAGETRNSAVTNASQSRFDVFVHLVSNNAVWQTNNGSIGAGIMLDWLDWMDAEMLLEDVRFLPVPADVPPGKAHFEVGLYSYHPSAASAPVDRIPILDGQGHPVADQINLAPVVVGGSPPQTSTSDLAPLNVEFEDVIELMGWKIARDPANPSRLLVELDWRALDRSMADVTAFVHLIDDSGQIITQQDGPPGGEDNPTSAWVPGERVHSTFVLTPKQDTRAIHGRLRIGLYEPASGRQIPITATSDESIIGPGATYVLLPGSG